MTLRAPCTSCNRHIREGAAECPFCKAAVRSSPVPHRLAHAVLALASTLVAPSAFAQVGDAAATPDAADAGPSQAELELERAQREVHPLYGMSPPPAHTCGCGVTGEGEDATSHALGASVLVGAVVLGRSRRKKPSA
ncbi:MAG: hypothetical protein HOO96_06335 [Polyangiaceae bacterium]|nr:hypothetical protein [Polyangiaceae bacterium]